MTTITVSTSAQLQTALTQAHGGDTILLQAGTYSALNLQSLNFSSAVTVTSADTSHPATMLGVVLNSCSGLSFTNLDFDGSAAPIGSANYPFLIASSSNILFDHLHVHGTMDGNPANDTQIMAVKSSTNVTISNSEFEQLSVGVGIKDSTYVQLLGNSFHDIQSDGIRGMQSSHVTISGNEFTNFFPLSGHGDAIQFWTTNTTEASHDLTISDNLVYQGTSGYVIQGVFLRDDVGGLPFQNVSIHNNVMLGTNYNAIAVIGGVNVDVAGNIAAQIPGQTQVPLIRIESVTNATLENNQAMQYQFYNPVTESGDVKIDPTSTQISNYLNTWLSAHSTITSAGSGFTTSTDTGTTTGTTTGSTTGTTTGSTTDSGGGSTTTTTHGKGSTKWGPHSKVVQASLSDHSDTLVTTSSLTKTTTTTTAATGLKSVNFSSDDFVHGAKHESALGFMSHMNETLASHGLPAAYAHQDYLANPLDMQFDHVWTHMPEWHLLS